ncbi:putative FMN-dependent 2-nitropropane dioxygenase [Rosellinia necatrix]|uniref:Putative FMN-dependent 2-nitropropane dioxygenase n=1 Tax=Rosellinia necatrix TaxID=77044 RepID=A0A1W2TKS8_ROSNE|nr:putative FMN-dependent 2-nitropropane dioxygenase [Rosellinia necatrix]
MSSIAAAATAVAGGEGRWGGGGGEGREGGGRGGGAGKKGKSRMQRWFPGTAHPLVVSAPMAFVTTPELATEVVRADGLGFIQGGRTFKPGSPDLAQLEAQLARARDLLSRAERRTDDVLPVGVGFVLFSDCAAAHFAATAAPILARHRPAAVWLFAPDPDGPPDTLRRIVESLRSSSTATTSSTATATAAATPPPPPPPPLPPPSPLRIVIQVGTVAAARHAAALGADVIVAQGIDAGGHQFARGAGVVSLVPEVCDMLREEFPDREIAVWAAGGIADGRGVAAALALGAEAAVLGTRYMVAPESEAQDYKREALLSASDGATSTVKSQIHDHVQGNRTWPALYDGRALVHPSYTDHQAGVPIEENEARYKAAKEKGDVSRMVTWSGSAVGLVRSALPAAEITRNVREEAVAAIERLRAAM